MDVASPVGPAVKIALAVTLAIAFLWAAPCRADNFAFVVSGAAGGEPYGSKYDEWRTALAETLASFGYPSDHVVALAGASREQIQGALRDLTPRLSKDDLLFVMLIGHGTADGDVAKFNLVGPDMSAHEWSEQLEPILARIVFVNATSGSFPFLRQLSRRGRIVVTATDSVAQQFETVFPEFFIKAFRDPAADGDKDGRVSIFEAFTYASINVRAWFDRQNRLPTERALLDDNGDGIAKLTFLQPTAAGASDPLAKRQSQLESALADLKARRSTMSSDAYEAELERLLTELAKVSAQRRR